MPNIAPTVGPFPKREPAWHRVALAAFVCVGPIACFTPFVAFVTLRPGPVSGVVCGAFAVFAFFSYLVTSLSVGDGEPDYRPARAWSKRRRAVVVAYAPVFALWRVMANASRLVVRLYRWLATGEE